MLIDERHLEQDPSAFAMPATIHAVLAARLDRLDLGERAIVEAGAVIGKSFGDAAAVALVRGGDRSELEPRLGALVRKQVVEPDGGRLVGVRTFSFKHILLHDVAYQGILKAHRADLHARYAHWLEGEAGERAGEYAEILGYHLERAHSYLAELGPIDERGRELAERASDRLGASGARALARGDIRPAVSLLERAVSLLPEDHPARRDLSVKLGSLWPKPAICRGPTRCSPTGFRPSGEAGPSSPSTTAPGSSTWSRSTMSNPRLPSAGARTTTSCCHGTARYRAGTPICSVPNRNGRWPTTSPAMART